MVGEAKRAWSGVGLSAAGLGRFLRAVQRAAGVEGEVNVLLADDKTLRRLNRSFLGKDKATDVLSFPAGATAVFFGEPGAEEMAGDVAISLETAARQAARYGHSLRDEVRVLMLHGVLHLAGFDHERDKGEMAAREGELRREFGLKGGVIGRVSREAKGGTGGRKVRGVGAGRSLSGFLRRAQDGPFALERRAQDDNSVGTQQQVLHSAQDDNFVGTQRQVLRSAQDDGLRDTRANADSSAALRYGKEGGWDSRGARTVCGEDGRPFGSIPHPAAIKPRRGWGTQAKKRVRR
jgi:probable rRNA maturation factor